MGLDQYLYKMSKQEKDANDIGEDSVLLKYYRKVNPLQGYFEKVFDMENCEFIAFGKDTIEDIEDNLKLIEKYYPKTFNILRERNHLLKEVDEIIFEFDDENEDEMLDLKRKLNEALLDQLTFVAKKEIRENDGFVPKSKLDITEGFFYGNYEVNEWFFYDLGMVMQFVDESKEALETLFDDEVLAYSCWY